MASAIQKITLSPSRDIPFNQLTLSQSNVRRVKAGVSIEELAEDIARRGLLQSLNVRPVLDAGGAETGMFEIPAGGRRYRALERLVKQKRLSRTAPVPCVVRDPATAILAEDDSLAENLQRAPLHPLDQLRAFEALRDKGQSEEDIAAAFFTSASVVRQRLRLASVSPKLLDVYAEDAMTLEQLMVFTVSADHARQEQVWEAIAGPWSKEPYQIRRMLTETTVRASDRRAVFVGLAAYEAAGGTVLRDLFHEDCGGWLDDVALLDSLVTLRLNAQAEAIAAEGWKWVAVAPDFPYGHTRGLRRIEGVVCARSDEEQAQFEALSAEHQALAAEHADADELPDAVNARLCEIEARLDALDTRPVAFDPSERARAGVFVSVGADGRLLVERGFVRPDDEAPVAVPATEADALASPPPSGAQNPAPSATTQDVITAAGHTIEGMGEEEDDEAIRPLPERLLAELSAHRTLALRDALARHPQVALTALLHKLVVDTFRPNASQGGCLEACVREVGFPAQAQDLKASACARAIAQRQDGWRTALPQEDQALWDWLSASDDATRMALLAHCVSQGVNALHEKPNPHAHGAGGVSRHGLERRLAQAGRLARETGLDMVEAGWRPGVANYLGRVPKQRIIEAVREGAGERAAQLIAHLKKDDMAREAERLLAPTRWLPEPLRSEDADAACDPGTEAMPEGSDDLPAFLSGDEDAAEETSEPPPAELAA
jgi:ParB family chromosome partitioning protein